MLVLSRKEGEKIVIRSGRDVIRVVVIEHARGRYRLGIDAPDEVLINREEIDARIFPQKPDVSARHNVRPA